MATKAELESELADLRRQLAERPAVVETDEAEPPEADTAEPETQKDEAAEAEIDWEQEVADVFAQFDDMTHKKPLLFALGAFSIGYLIGRSK